jgi:hypothetical protein
MMFERGKIPGDSMGLGIEGTVKKWLKENNLDSGKPEAEFDVKVLGEGLVSVSVKSGNAVFRDLDTAGSGVPPSVRINHAKSRALTVVSDLSERELYDRIREIAREMIRQCLGRPVAEQEDWVFGEGSGPGSLKGHEIPDAHPYISHMPRDPGPSDISDLKEEVRQRTLEFLNKARPDISVFFGEILAR